jgi:hypothetical protein
MIRLRCGRATCARASVPQAPAHACKRGGAPPRGRILRALRRAGARRLWLNKASTPLRSGPGLAEIRRGADQRLAPRAKMSASAPRRLGARASPGLSALRQTKRAQPQFDPMPLNALLLWRLEVLPVHPVNISQNMQTGFFGLLRELAPHRDSRQCLHRCLGRGGRERLRERELARGAWRESVL